MMLKRERGTARRGGLSGLLSRLPLLLLFSSLAGPVSAVVISEIHYHPPPGDEALEFVEIANDTSTPEDISGYAFVTGIQYEFPRGTILPGRGTIVVCADVDAIKSRYGIDNALGNYARRLAGGGEEITLVNHVGIVVATVSYGDKGRWPVAPDGSGHTLILRGLHLDPAEPESWTWSPRPGGSPGETNLTEPLPPLRDVIMFNELFRGIGDQDGWIELHSANEGTIDLTGYSVTDAPSRDAAFLFPAGTILPPGGFVVLEDESLPLALSGREVRLFLLDPDGLVVAAEVFDRPPPPGSTVGEYSEARFPDGGRPGWVTTTPTPGEPNRVPWESDIVINEIFYHPPEERSGEFIELYNRGEAAVDLSRFRFTSGVTFLFPEGTVLDPDGYLVVAEEPDILRLRYGVNDALGPYEGRLANGGENVRLVDAAGNLVDEVRYFDGGRWSRRADGRGSSLELIDPRQDNDFASAWGASNESGKAEWEELSVSIRDFVPAVETELHLYLVERGACLIDDLRLIREGGEENLIPNPGFEDGTEPWRIEGTHTHSRRTTSDRHSGEACLEVVATAKGDTLCNRIETDTVPQMSAGNYELSMWARWQSGTSLLIVHGEFTDGPWGPLSGNTMAARLRLTVPWDLGTPGAENSARRRLRKATGGTNLGPVIDSVEHRPVSPPPDQPTTLVARVQDADGVESVRGYYRAEDPDGDFDVVELFDDGAHSDGHRGDGLYGGELPGFPDRTRIVFYIEAVDALGHARRFPVEAPESTSVFMVEKPIDAPLDLYRVILDARTTLELQRRRLHSNDLLPGTLVLNDAMAIYDTGIRYRGSAWGRPSGKDKNFRVRFPKDRRFLRGHGALNISDKGSSPKEGMAYFMVTRSGTPQTPAPAADYLFGGAVFNGRILGKVGLIQPVDRSYIETWYGAEAADDAIVIKGNGRQAFSDDCQQTAFDAASLVHRGENSENYRGYWIHTLHQTRDRWEPFFELTRVVDPAYTSDAEFDRLLDSVLDVEAFLRVLAPRIVMGEGDAIFIGGGHNGYLVHDPRDQRWKLLPFDMDGAFGDLRTLFPQDRFTSRLLSRPGPRRTYLRILHELVEGYWSLDTAGPLIEALDAGALRVLITATASKIHEVVDPAATVPLRVITGGGDVVTTSSRAIELEGEAPVQVASLLYRRRREEYRELFPQWSSATVWRAVLEVPDEENVFELIGLATGGELIGRAGVTVRRVSGREFLRGDANNDLVVNLTDALAGLRFLFGGARLTCEDTVDVDDDGHVDLSDIVLLLEYLFRSGPSPAAPFPEVGGDPTGDDLDCR